MNSMFKSLLVLTFASALWVGSALAASTQQVLVEGMTCSGCANSIKAAFKKLAEVKSVQVDVEKGTVLLEFQPEKTLSEKQIRDAVKQAGYQVTKVSPAKSS